MKTTTITTIKILLLPILAAAALCISGCASMLPNTGAKRSTSVVEFLYPNKQPFVEPSIPTLSLPMRVGVAFVPPLTENNRSNPQMPEATKNALMRAVSDQFKKLPYVRGIELVPTQYLRPGGSFENLDQLRSLLGIDVIVLLAYDQQQNTTDTPLILSYWTIIGAYTMPAQKNSTATLMDAAVYDIASRKMLFRAAGADVTNHRSTAVGTTDQLVMDSGESYKKAATNLSANLQAELESFKLRIKESPEEVKVVAKPGYNLAAGALGGWEVAGMVVFAAVVMLLSMVHQAGGLKDFSRWLRSRQRPTPPESMIKKFPHPEGVPDLGGLRNMTIWHPSRMLFFWMTVFRWCRSPSLAQPPAKFCQASGLKSPGLKALFIVMIMCTGIAFCSTGCVSTMMLSAGNTEGKIFGWNKNPANRTNIEKRIGLPAETKQLSALPTRDEFREIEKDFRDNNRSSPEYLSVDVYYDRLHALNERSRCDFVDKSDGIGRASNPFVYARYNYKGRIISSDSTSMHQLISSATWGLAEPILVPVAAWTLATGHDRWNSIEVWYDDSGLVVAYTWARLSRRASAAVSKELSQ